MLCFHSSLLHRASLHSHCSFLPKFPFFSLTSSSRPKTPSGFSPFCTISYLFETETVAVENNSESNKKTSIKDAAGLLDIRVGQIMRAWKHDEAESLYVEDVDIWGEKKR